MACTNNEEEEKNYPCPRRVNLKVLLEQVKEIAVTEGFKHLFFLFRRQEAIFRPRIFSTCNAYILKLRRDEQYDLR